MKTIGSFVDGNGRLATVSLGTGKRWRVASAERKRYAEMAERNAERHKKITDGVGSWPDPEHPGVPLHPERDGAHWLRWPPSPSDTPQDRQGGQGLMIAQWGGDLQMWVISYLNSTFTEPVEMEHLNYICEAEPPGPWTLPPD
jgi:hypothetical protein